MTDSQVAFEAATMRTRSAPQAQAQQAYGNPNHRRPVRSAASAAKPKMRSDGVDQRCSHAKPPTPRAASASQAPNTSPSIRSGVSTSAATSLPPQATQIVRANTEIPNKPMQIRIAVRRDEK